jgi:hypothetical protein
VRGLESTNGTVSIASTATTLDLTTPVTTLTSAGGTSLVTDGTGPTLAVRGLTSTDASVTITSNPTNLDLSVVGGAAVTLANAGGTTIITDGTGPSLAIKGQIDSPSLKFADATTATAFAWDNACIRIADLTGTLPPATVYQAVASGNGAVALGVRAKAQNDSATAVGIDILANGTHSAIVGSGGTVTAADAVGFFVGPGGGVTNMTQTEAGFIAARGVITAQVSYAYLGEGISYLNGALFHQWNDPVLFSGAATYAPTAANLLARNHIMSGGAVTTFQLPSTASLNALSSSWGRNAVGGTIAPVTGRGHYFCVTNSTGGPLAFDFATGSGASGSYSLIDETNSVYVAPADSPKSLPDGLIHILVLKSNGVSAPGVVNWRLEHVGSRNTNAWA